MNSRNEDKLSMYEKVSQFLKDHINEVSVMIGTATTAKANYDEKLADLMYIISQSGSQTTGYTQIKEKARTKLESMLLRTMRSLKAYSLDMGLPDLLAKSDYSRSSVERLRDSDLYTTSLRIHELASEHLTALSVYSYTTNHLNDLAGSSAAYFEVIQLPKDKIGERASYNKLIELKMNDIDELLKGKFDTYLSLLEFENIQLYEQYRSARNIDNSRGYGSSKQYKGTVSAGLTAVIVEQNYDADRSYTFYNKGNSELTFGLSIDGIDFIGTTVTLQPNDELSRDASDFNDEGSFLIVQNNGIEAGSYEIDADK